jgi:hypothetical protein
MIIKMNTTAVLKAIRVAAQPRLDIMADELRNHLAAELDGGSLPIHSDTMALSTSLSVQTPQGSDSDIRTSAARAQYLAEGRHTAAVRLNVTQKAYTAPHFDERVAPEEILLGSGVRARVFTRLAYGAWWFFGHDNVFTKRYETPRDWIERPAIEFAAAKAHTYFMGLV